MILQAVLEKTKHRTGYYWSIRDDLYYVVCQAPDRSYHLWSVPRSKIKFDSVENKPLIYKENLLEDAIIDNEYISLSNLRQDLSNLYGIRLLETDWIPMLYNPMEV